MIHLAVGLPIGEVPVRNEEYVECFRKNVENPAITTVIAIQEEKPLPPDDKRNKILENKKVRLFQLGRRATFEDYFSILSSNELQGTKGFANSDVHFDFSIRQLDRIDLKSYVLAISRTDHLSANSVSGHDAWMFTNAPKVKAAFPLGYDWCDWRILEVLTKAGHTVLNPAYSVRLVHVHRWRRQRSEAEKVHDGVYPKSINVCMIQRGSITSIRTVPT